jgi:hypothetical protein
LMRATVSRSLRSTAISAPASSTRLIEFSAGVGSRALLLPEGPALRPP